jgi:hypothetical protein
MRKSTSHVANEAQDHLEGKVINNVPDAEGDGEGAETAPGTARCQPRHSQKHEEGRQLSPHLHQGDAIGGQQQGKSETLGVVDGPQVDHHRTFQKAEGHREQDEPAQARGQ